MGLISQITRWNKVWILTTAISLMLYDLYWIRGVNTRIYERLLENLPDITAKYPNFYVDHVAGGIADTLRLVAVILFFIAAYLTWGPRKQSFAKVRKYISISIMIEAIYWLAILPYNLLNVARGRDPLLLFVGFVVQILAVAPLLILLSVKTWGYRQERRGGLIKWGCVAGIGYIFGMWANNTLRWLSMSGQFGPADPRTSVDLFNGIAMLGFMNTVITLTMSLAFAATGSYFLLKRNNNKLVRRLLSLAILLFGMHFALYIAYSWFAPDAWRFVLLTEVWPAPLTGLGIGLLRGKSELP